MLAAVAAHLKSKGTYDDVVLMRLTGINKDSDELHLPAKPASATAPCTTDAISIWQNAGYRPSLLLKGWDGTTDAFRKNFPDKSFSVAIIASTNPFPPIDENGNVITGTVSNQSLPLLTLAAQKFPGHLVIQNNTLYPNVPAQPETLSDVQSLGTMLAYQTNEDISGQGRRAARRARRLPAPRRCFSTSSRPASSRSAATIRFARSTSRCSRSTSTASPMRLRAQTRSFSAERERHAIERRSTETAPLLQIGR